MIEEKITLDDIVSIVSEKFGEQTVTKDTIKNDNLGIIFIHDKGTTSPVAFTNSEGELDFENYNNDKVHCVLLETDMIDFHMDNPYMLLSYALAGGLDITDIDIQAKL